MPRAKDGMQFGGQMGVNQHNAGLAGGMKPLGKLPKLPDDGGGQQDQPQSIQDDPKAMQLVDALKALGYTADDVAEAMGEGTEDAGLQPPPQGAPGPGGPGPAPTLGLGGPR